ncbi:TCR/Tet family MFS transporter [Solimicrobium silvestre]|uniref:Major Facilitator Superfamily n=1 Tax=Solimicrobium silvestre TaxID=2099400 RepID=A0A2S9H2F8_9BURK|nr:TCR/Tet family MFS transporter [Solimicrobium silvestre]PRC94164.1 Major Facilitator Superfamily [Solimicrobium silvestre]
MSSEVKPPSLINSRFVLITVFLDILGIGLIIPVLPRMVAMFAPQPDQQAYWYGAIVAAYAIMQFFCAPLLGALSDRFGRRPILLICVLGLGLNFFLMTQAPSLIWLLVIRAMGGMTAGNIAVANAYIADVSKPENRGKALGKIGAMFGMGFICGPMLGGLLGEQHYQYPFYLAAIVSLCNFSYGLVALPESLPLNNRRAFSFTRANPLHNLKGLTQLKNVGALVWSMGFSLFAQFTMQTTWVLSTELRFGWTPLQNGISLFMVGVCSVVMQGFLLGGVIRRLGEAKTAMWGLSSSCLVLIMYGVTQQGWIMYLLIPCNILGYAAAPAIQAIFSKAVDAKSQGAVMGSLSSLGSVMSVCATLLGTSLLAQVGHFPKGNILLGAPFFMAAFAQGMALLIAMKHFSNVKKLI